MKYLLPVCRDNGKMNGQTEPDPGAAGEEEPFPWVDELRARASG